MNKKGKDFFKMTSSLTETIQNIAVEDTRIWTGCECIYNLYDDGKDIALFASKDQIHDLLAAHLTRTSDFDTILACQDNCIRVVHGSQLFLEIPTSSAVMSLAMMEIEGGSGSGINTVTTTSTTSASRSSMLVYGMSNGSLGLVQVFSNGTFNMAWTIEDVKRSPVTCLKVFDINRNGVPEVIVGRDDGRIEVFRFPSADAILSEPSKIFSKDIGESIRSVECGAVNTPEYNEILVASYSGKIISFTTEPIHVRATDDNYGRSIQTINNENRIKYMRKELEEMRKRVEKEREKVKKISLMGHANTTMMKPVQDFSVISSFKLDADLAAYVLSIELQTSIDLVVIRSPVALDLVETDSGTSVLSVTPPDLQPMHAGEELAGRFVAVFRCQSQHEKRIVLTLRTNEGEHGDMTVTIVAACVPKAAKIIKYNLKPLSLNSRIHQIDSVDLRRPRNRVKYSGE
jgi:Bardet-Biedl syndrome 7 protein